MAIPMPTCSPTPSPTRCSARSASATSAIIFRTPMNRSAASAAWRFCGESAKFWRRESGASINIDATLIAEAPKIGAASRAMRDKIATALRHRIRRCRHQGDHQRRHGLARARRRHGRAGGGERGDGVVNSCYRQCRFVIHDSSTSLIFATLMAFRLFNTYSRADRGIPTARSAGRTVKMYTCGPTVYNHAHIGNFRAYLFEDLLQRHLEARGYQVDRVMNLTDVDDKTIRGSRACGSSAGGIHRAVQGRLLPGPRHAADQAGQRISPPPPSSAYIER